MGESKGLTSLDQLNAMASLFSPSEVSFTTVPLASTSKALAGSGAANDFTRSDGRAPLAYRDLDLETSVSDGSIGSARVRIGGSSDYTEVWAGVRGEIEDVQPASSSTTNSQKSKGAGRVVVTLECAPTALPNLRADLPLQLANLLSTIFSSSTLPPAYLSDLVVLPNSKAWTLYLDVLVVSATAGNVVDLAVMAARSALALTRVPKTRIVGYDDGVGTSQEMEDTGGFSGLVKGGKAGTKAADFELVDGGWGGGRSLDGLAALASRLDSQSCLRLPSQAIQLNVTDAIPRKQVQQQAHLDATLLEEAASESQLVASFTGKGDLCGLSQLGEGEIKLQRVMSLLQVARTHALELMSALNAKLS